MSQIREFLKSVLIFFMGNISSKIISFLMLPLYTNIISPADYGTYDLGVNYSNFLYNTLYFAIWVGTLRFMHKQKEVSWKQKVVTHSSILFALFTCFYTVVFYLVNQAVQIEDYLHIFVYGFLLACQMQVSYIARGYKKNALFAFSGTANTIVTAVLNILLISVFRMKYQLLFISADVGILVQLVILITGMKKELHFSHTKIQIEFLKEIFKYCAPLLLNFSAMWFMTNYNRVVIVQKLGAEQNGYYAIAAKFNMIITLLGNCVGFAWQEVSFQRGYRGEKDTDFYNNATSFYLKTLFCGYFLSLPIISIMFNVLIGPAYLSSKGLIPLAMLGAMLGVFGGFLGDIFLALNKTTVVSISLIISGGINIIAVHLLLPKYGIGAANVAAFLGYTANIVIRYMILKKFIGVQIKGCIKIIIAGSFYYIFAQWMFNKGNFWGNCLILIITLVMTLFSYKELILRLIRQEEKL